MMPALIVVAPVYEVILVIRALETVGQGYLGVAGTDRSLIEQIAPVPVGQIMQIETMGCIGDRAVHHGVVIAVEDIDLLTGDVVRVDIDPDKDSMRFERMEQKVAQDSGAKAEAAQSAASSAKSGRKR